MSKVPIGPTYDEMYQPNQLDPKFKARAQAALKDELDPYNLFNITWRNQSGAIHKIVLPKALTGVDANIVVMLGKHFPSGSHKVGPAYATLMEGIIDGDIVPGYHNILGPSTGNFGIGVAYIANLMRLKSTIIMPDNMSKERYDRIKGYGGNLDLTPGTESDVILTLEKTHKLSKDEKNVALAQFELMPNYRFHRHITGQSAVEACTDIGDGKIKAFVSAPGSAGTLAAGDHIKTVYPEATITALEPYECSTLMNGGRGQHRIEGIGDKMCTLIHNVLNTDYIALIRDEDTIRGLKVLRDGKAIFKTFGLETKQMLAMRDYFGVSGVCNILGAIKMAKHLKLSKDDNVVTLATDGFDRYDSVLKQLESKHPNIDETLLKTWFKEVFLNVKDDHIKKTTSEREKQRLFKQKEDDWLKFGYDKAYLDAMKTKDFWEKEYQKVHEYNAKIEQKRGKAL